jgi:gluconate 2-dehydrogenase gamma chain
MDPRHLDRRAFVASLGSVGAVWLLADAADRAHAMQHAVEQRGAQQPRLSFFSREQAVEIEAVVSRIIPSDATPGAREAGVVYFIDRGLATWAREQQPMVTEGLAKLGKDVEAKYPGESRFSALGTDRQDEVLKSIQDTPFFGVMRFATIAGMFALPAHGGNRDFVGWKLIGHDTVLDFKPPFGWYDQPANRRRLLGE